MKLKKDLEKRMYFLVPYNISEIQKGIQAGHAALKYARKYADKNPAVWDFVDNHETWIVLNGGTTNSERELGTGVSKGTLNQTLDNIADFNKDNPELSIEYSMFIEPDLNNALTAICLIVDERVFNLDDYPDFYGWVTDMEVFVRADDTKNWNILKDRYAEEVGKDIAFLKELLNTKKLA